MDEPRAGPIPPPEHGREAQKRRRGNIATDIAEGMPVRDVCLKYDVSYSTVRNACQEHQVAMPSTVGRSRTQRVHAFTILRDMLLHPEDDLSAVAQRNYISIGAVEAVHRDAELAGFRLMVETGDRNDDHHDST